MTARYGPHDPTTAPTEARIFEDARRGLDDEFYVPMPVVLVRQRELLNRRAHQEAAQA